MSTRVLSSQPAASPPTPRLLLPDGLRLQPKCACGAARNDNEESCADCQRAKVQKRSAGGASDDAFEREADRVAEDVLHPSPAKSNGPAQVRRLPTSDAQSVPHSVGTALRHGGQSLEPTVRSDMEKRFGYDFSAVRIHTDEAAQRSTQELDAHAYTVGRDVVFGAGRFSPGTSEGRGLLAHELTHVVQQGAAAGATGTAAVQRKPDPKKPEAKKAEPKKDKGQAGGKKAAVVATGLKLDVTATKNAPPCACVVVVHNDERNARKTTELMHQHCQYNLAMINVTPDIRDRDITIPGGTKELDTNALFPRSVAEECLDNEQTCRDFVKSSANPMDLAVIQKQFFLAVHDCSAGFSLPVVALHNNDIEDTEKYLRGKDKAGVSDLKLDVDKRKKETGADQIAKLKSLIKTMFGDVAGADIVKKMMDTPKKTNIFRWCVASDLSRCHIGDPDHPDNVTWVTNEADFSKLSKKNLNVVLQSEVPKATGNSESEGDLSTLFLLLRDILTAQLPANVPGIERQLQVDLTQIERLLDELRNIFEFDDQTFGNVLQRLLDIVVLLWGVLRNAGAIQHARVTKSRIEKLHFVNIETPGKRLTDQSDAERVRNYESIVEVLQILGLHCCGTDPKQAAQAETNVKEGLKGLKEK